jgi:mRNA-degrading endonuclease RelE of RelBE toxin-antitoxin system
MEVKLHRRVEKSLDKINEPDFSRLIKGLSRLKAEPPTGDIVPLSGSKAAYRLRIGNYRFLFAYNFDENGYRRIEVYKLDLRGGVYKGD